MAMLAGCSYLKAFQAFGFADNQREFYTGHPHLISALEKPSCTVKRKRFRSWSKITGRAIVAVNHKPQTLLMKKIKIAIDDKYYKSDEIVHGRIIRKFIEELSENVFKKAHQYCEEYFDITGSRELPLLYGERNLYSIFASAIGEITPVHLSEWSFNKSDSGADTRRVDFWCLNKGSANGKAINYFIEIKKNYYCVSEGTQEEFSSVVNKSVTKINQQIKNLKSIRPEWDGDGDVYIGIIVTHAYCSAKKEQEYDEAQIRDNIHKLLDKRSRAQLLLATWTLPDDIKVQWEKSRCKFISIAGIAISKSR